MNKSTLRWRIAQWLEIRWWRNYLRTQEVERYAEQKTNYWQRILDTLDIRLPPKQQVLDAGCGPAGVFMLLNNQQVDAMDPLLEQYADQLEHFKIADYPWVNFHSSSLESYPKTKSYDYTFCLNAINHVSDWKAGMDRLAALTKPNGTLVLGVDVHRYSFLKKIFRTLPGDVLHPHQHDREDYRQALQHRGWQIEKEHTWKEGFIFDYWLVVCRASTAN
jgi:2-polyprenyl-6-hydroxyphenyl methylase/3-demethylubiquinone-9 3-methyltransferase